MQSLNQNENELKHLHGLISALKPHDLKALEYDVDSSVDYTLHKYTNEELDQIDIDSLKDEIHSIENDLKKQTPNLNAIQSYIDLVSVFACPYSLSPIELPRIATRTYP
jgi:hypothetical protein